MIETKVFLLALSYTMFLNMCECAIWNWKYKYNLLYPVSWIFATLKQSVNLYQITNKATATNLYIHSGGMLSPLKNTLFLQYKTENIPLKSPL